MDEPELQVNAKNRFNFMIIAEDAFQSELDDLVHWLFGTGVRIEDGFEFV